MGRFSLGKLKRRILQPMLVLASAVLLGSALPDHACGQWSANSLVNTAVCTADGEQSLIQAVDDGAGGAIIVWQDRRSLSACDIYAQRVNALGIIQWAPDGVPVCRAANDQLYPQLVGDGAGGAIIAWDDFRSGADDDIYAQRVDASGAVVWPADGVAICSAVNAQGYPRIAGDGAGGAIITWHDWRSETNMDIYAQRVTAAGAPQWMSNGAEVCLSLGNQHFPQITDDGAGGAIIVWVGDSNEEVSLFAQHLNSSGVRQWDDDGVALCRAGGSQVDFHMIGDGLGGAIVTWQDTRTGVDYRLYAQSVDPFGNARWAASGVMVCATPINQIDPCIAADGAGGAVFGWRNLRDAENSDIAVQRVSSQGLVQWTAAGRMLFSRAAIQAQPVMLRGDNAGPIIAWESIRSVKNSDFIAQRLDTAGNFQWTSEGVDLFTSDGYRIQPALIGDGKGGALMFCQDYRSGAADIYAQNIDASGHLGFPPTIVSVRDVSDDQGGRIALTWEHSHLDASPNSWIDRYEVYHRTFPAAPGSPLTWELLDTVNAAQQERYSLVVPTISDSGPHGYAMQHFMVRALTASQLYWDSHSDSGCSIDNLAPVAIPALAAALLADGTVHLHWPPNTQDPDFDHYAIYRSALQGFLPDETTHVASCPDSSYIDTAAPEAPMAYYRVCARDIHGNAGPPSPEASVTIIGTCVRTMQQKWNLVSVPLTMAEYTRAALFPSAAYDAVGFGSDYETQTILENKKGYWLRFTAKEPVSMTGRMRLRDTIDLRAGWNLIGSISVPVPIGGIVEIPAGTINSHYYSYTGAGYVNASVIEPMAGYWVRAQRDGKLVLAGGNGKRFREHPNTALEKFNRLVLSDADRHEATLYFAQDQALDPDAYALPPLLPDTPDLFDLRFASNSSVACGTGETGLMITGVRYPLTIRWQIDRAVSASLVVDGIEHPMHPGGSLTLNTPAHASSLRINGAALPADFALDQNYPNPFNPATVIRFALPVGAHVSLDVFNSLGARVARLVNSDREAGYHRVMFDASDLASGVYFYRLQAGSFMSTKRLVILR